MPEGYAKPITPQTRASKTYQSNHMQGAADRVSMAEAMRVVIQKLLLARDTYSANALDHMLEHNSKNIKILDVLREELRGSGAHQDAEAAESAKFLHKLYTDAILRISGILSKPDPVAEFNALIELFKPVYKAWLPPSSAAAQADAAAKPSAPSA